MTKNQRMREKFKAKAASMDPSKQLEELFCSSTRRERTIQILEIRIESLQ